MLHSIQFRVARAVSATAMLALVLAVGCPAPILPQRSKPGGSARWAADLAQQKAIVWQKDAQICRITGAGVGTEGWLPDRGGTWVVSYWSAARPGVYQVTVDSDGGVRPLEVKQAPEHGRTLPADWLDSPQIWAATRRHQVTEPMHTLDADFSLDVDPEHYKDRAVWRIRFYRTDNSFETHIVAADGTWLAVE